MTADILYLYGDIIKRDAAQRVVEGYVSSPKVDLDQQIVDQDWLRGELPPWMRDWGNIRAQHDPMRAVGKAKSVDLDAQPGPYLVAKIVDDDAWAKVQEGVYNGFSVGIKNPILVQDKAAPHGRIVGGKLIEISIVDRPANDAAKFVLVKSAGTGEWKDMQTGAVIADTAKREFSQDERDRLADSGAAMPDGSYPIKTEQDLRNAIHAIGRAKDPAKAKAHIIRRAKALGKTDLLPTDWPGSSKKDDKDAEAAAEAEAGTKMRKRKDAEADATVRRDADADADAAPHTPVTPDHPEPDDDDDELSDGDTDNLHDGIWDDQDMKDAEAAPQMHPYTGVHSHSHNDGHGGMHAHGHLHKGEGMHSSHPHCGIHGVDARLCAKMDHSLATQPHVKAAKTEAKKAAPTFEAPYPTPAQPRRASTIGGEVETLLRDALARIEALVNDNRDGDVDFPEHLKDEAARGEKINAGDFQSDNPAPSLISRTPLELRFGAEPDVVKLSALEGFEDYHKRLVRYIEKTVKKALEEQTAVTKAATTESLSTAGEIAKLAGGLAKGLEALADKTKATTEELTTLKAAVDEQKAELAKVKDMAAPVKGATFAVDKGFLLEPDKFVSEAAAKGADPTAVLAEQLGHMTEQQRIQVAAALAQRQYRGQK